MHHTTILCLQTPEETIMACDGQVTLGETQIKQKARKIRRLYHDKVLVGFAGSAADGLALMQRLETRLEEFRGNVERAVVELAREWRLDKALRHLQALCIVADPTHLFLLSGSGDIIQPDEPLLAIGSGGNIALAAAKALLKHTTLKPQEIVQEAMAIAASLCIYTNDQITLEVLHDA